MKKIFKYFIIAAFGLSLASLTGCQRDELDTDQFSGYALAAISPNPVMRGGELRIIGSGLESTSKVQFAGDVTVTDITVVESGSRSEIRVIVPVEGPEIGPVTVVSSNGETASTRFDLEYSEPIGLDEVTPAEALSGDVVTLKGEYLNVVRCVIFGGDVKVNEFVSQSRYELKVAVPANAVTGPVIVSDVDEIADETTIPNRIYSTGDLVIGDPTVTEAPKATYKSGDEITVTGSHLDMIEKVDLEGASEVEFTVSEDGTSISFILPASATDGNIVLTSYAGNTFNAGEIETVTVADLDIVSIAEDGRYKAGSNVRISGSDLDLVTKVEFNGGEGYWYYSEGEIIAEIPASAKDGSVTVTLESGKQAWTPEIEVVKPVATGISDNEAVAGNRQLAVYGTDLDLVTGVTIGDKANGLIPCGFSVAASDTVYVNIPSDAYTGVLTLSSAAGYETVTETVTVTYDEAVSVTFDQPSYSLGRNISISGKNLLQVEEVYIKGKKVMSFSTRADDAMVFALPDGIGPGVYRLDFVLVDGTQLTWAVPFEVTAPYTETFIWEGYEDLAGWGNSPYFGAEDAFITAGMQVGDIVRVYFDVLNPDWWQFQLHDGHWGNVAVDELGGDITVSKNNTEEGATYFAFTVTDAILAQLTSIQGWGGAFLTNGEGVAITGISLIHFGLTETTLWEGSMFTGNYATNLEIGGEDDWVNAELPEGAEIRVYFTPDDASDWSLQLFDGHWGSLSYVTPNGVQFNMDNAPEAVGKGYVSFIAEGSAYQALTSHQGWGFALIVQGKNITVTKLAFM